MNKPARKRTVADSKRSHVSEGFPETRTEVLQQAAAGNWAPFLDQYLRPCWREVVIACRRHGIPLPDADDLYQELMLRLLREGGFGPHTRGVLAEKEQDADYRANLAGRYLKFRELPLRSARFRTYLKDVIRNLVLEALRSRRRRPKPLSDQVESFLEPWFEQSISQSLDRQWIAGCLVEAAWCLWSESARARTRGQRRLFEVLYLFTVEDRTPADIARQFGLDRTTISGLLTDAKARFMVHLQKAAAIAAVEELRGAVAGLAGELEAAMVQVHEAAKTRQEGGAAG